LTVGTPVPADPELAKLVMGEAARCAYPNRLFSDPAMHDVRCHVRPILHYLDINIEYFLSERERLAGS
jgi:hypothetical protein